jgi:hypothetical protein
MLPLLNVSGPVSGAAIFSAKVAWHSRQREVIGLLKAILLG